MPVPDTLRLLLFWLAAAALVLAHAAVVAMMLRHVTRASARPGAAPGGSGAPGGPGAVPAWGELAMVLAPAALTAALLVLAWRSL